MVPMCAHSSSVASPTEPCSLRGRASATFLSLLLVGLLAGCGSGGSGSGGTSASSPPTTVTQAVGSAGGMVSLPDGSTVTFNGGVLKDGTQVTVSSSPTAQTSVPTGMLALSRTVTVEIPAGSLSNTQANNTGSVTIEIPRQVSTPVSSMLQFLAPNEAFAQSVPTSDPFDIIKVDLQTNTAGSTPMYFPDSLRQKPSWLISLVNVPISMLSDVIPTRIQAMVLNVRGCYPNSMELYQVNQDRTFTRTIAPESGKTPLILVHGIQEPLISPVLGLLSCQDPFRSTWSELSPIYPRKFVDLFVMDTELASRFQLFSINYNTLDPVYRTSGPALAQLLKGTFHQTPVVVLAHSMGGLVTRAAMKEASMDPDGARITGVVSLATPHQGTPVASYEFLETFRSRGLGFTLLDLVLMGGFTNSGGGQGFKDLAWDNFDGRGLHGPGPSGVPGPVGNSDLDDLRVDEALNNRSQRIFALAGGNPGSFFGLVPTLSEFRYPSNDSLVPTTSALFGRVVVRGNQSFLDLGHSSILNMGTPLGTPTEVFNSVRSALLGFHQSPPPSTFTLVVAKQGAGAGTVTSSGGSINCGTVCTSQPINSGDSVVLTAAPGNGSIFTGWSGGGCSGTGTCTVTMTANQTVTATFAGSFTPVDGTGTWQGTYSDSFETIPHLITMNITQTGTNVSGSWTALFASNGGGTVSGTFTGTFTSGSVMTFVRSQTQTSLGPCPGSFSSTATVSANSISGTYSGSDCLGFHSNGQVSLTKQAAPPPPYY